MANFTFVTEVNLDAAIRNHGHAVEGAVYYTYMGSNHDFLFFLLVTVL